MMDTIDLIDKGIVIFSEKLFESYVAHEIRKSGIFNNISTQHNQYSLAQLMNNNHDKFRLKPDIFGEAEESIYILDTKWKLINQTSENRNFEISQSDMYQLFGYGKIYENHKKSTTELYLIYPKTKDFEDSIDFQYYDRNNINLKVVPFPLESKTTTEELIDIFLTQSSCD